LTYLLPIGLLAVQQSAVEEGDYPPLVLLRAGIDAACVTCLRDLPERFGLAGGVVVDGV